MAEFNKEEMKIKGSELVDSVKKLIREGNVRRITIKKESGDVLFEIPLTTGVAVGGALVMFAPVLAAIGAMAALVTNVHVEVERNDEEEGTDAD